MRSRGCDLTERVRRGETLRRLGRTRARFHRSHVLVTGRSYDVLRSFYIFHPVRPEIYDGRTNAVRTAPPSPQAPGRHRSARAHVTI